MPLFDMVLVIRRGEVLRQRQEEVCSEQELSLFRTPEERIRLEQPEQVRYR